MSNRVSAIKSPVARFDRPAYARHLRSLLPQVDKPSRYCGNEFNTVKKDWQTAAGRIALLFPDLYEIGMSHQGLQILYHIINASDRFLAERAYVPAEDLEHKLRNLSLPLFSLESKRPLTDFDAIGITLPYELCYSNILTVLDLLGMPFRASDRDEKQPLILGGGPAAFHAEPVADFFDAILLGDGEEAILEMLEVIAQAKLEDLPRKLTLDRLAAIDGVYVPSLFRPDYDAAGQLSALTPLKTGYSRVKRRILSAFQEEAAASRPIVPFMRIVHDRLGVEIARGCTRGCRFCQAGMIYRPVRERSAAEILRLAENGIRHGGFEELALLSLSTGDYSCLGPLLGALMDRFAQKKVSVSMPSMRVGTLTTEVMEQIRRVRKTGFTLAPEAGSERLRLAINKGISEEDLLATCRQAAALGWRQIKLYFMFGLPTETDEDIEAIVTLAGKAARSAGRNCTIVVSAATFVPKPHTPFQRHGQLSLEEGYQRVNLLKRRLAARQFKLKWHDPRQSYLEGVFSRGDRRLASVIETAWRLGARLDAWSDKFDLARWQQAAETAEIDLGQYLRQRRPDEVLPWQHLDTGVEDVFLEKELEKAVAGIYTSDCRVHGCQQCGVCDFKTVQPLVAARKKGEEQSCSLLSSVSKAAEKGDGGPFQYRIEFSKVGEARLLSHLEMLQVFFRAFRRLRLPLCFSKGFNPTPKVSFGPALSMGIESMAEFLLVTLHRPIADAALFLRELNDQLPEGLSANTLESGRFKMPDAILSAYCGILPVNIDADKVATFLGRETAPVTVVRKNKEKEIDVRPLVSDLSITGTDTVELQLRAFVSTPGIKPQEFFAWLFNLSEEQTFNMRIVKLWSKEELDPGKGKRLVRDREE
ncbi:MAG: TIGR03960 family B12-binding radical SAM protein [Deltaproteobacteria bacterium]